MKELPVDPSPLIDIETGKIENETDCISCSNLKTEALSISWHNITAESSNTKILKDISGQFQAKSLSAIIGRSGSGKTTLMNILTGNKTGLVTSGEIKLNDITVGGEISKISGYVRQDDIFLGELTVAEHLQFRSRLEDQSISNTEREIKIQNIMERFQLTDQANTQIGTPGIKKTLSGGERKRLSLGTEILSDPQILFCDEPTTGLDSNMAYKVMVILRNLTESGITVICTIHQPSSKIVALFSQIMLMTNGEIAFVGSNKECLNYFASVNRPLPQFYNPADYYMDVLDPFDYENVDLIRKTIERYRESYQKYEPVCERKCVFKPMIVASESRAGRATQTLYLVQRQLIRMIRDPLVLKAKLAESLFIAFWYGLMYWRSENPYTVTDYQYSWGQIKDINGALVVSVLFLSIMFIVVIALRFMLQMPLLRRELSDSVFHFSSFFIADNIVMQLFATVLPLLYSTITYFLFGLRKGWIYWFNYTWVLMLEASLCIGIGYFVSAFSPNIDFTIALLPAAIVPMIVFCGYLINEASTPVYMLPLRYLSWYRYVNELLQINQWGGIMADEICREKPQNASGLQTVEFTYHSEIFGDYHAVLNDHDVCNVRFPKGGESILDEMGFSADNWYFNIAALLVLTIGSRLGAYAILSYRLKRDKQKK